jgi:hypothetical protein
MRQTFTIISLKDLFYQYQTLNWPILLEHIPKDSHYYPKDVFCNILLAETYMNNLSESIEPLVKYLDKFPDSLIHIND